MTSRRKGVDLLGIGSRAMQFCNSGIVFSKERLHLITGANVLIEQFHLRVACIRAAVVVGCGTHKLGVSRLLRDRGLSQQINS